jgi:GTP-binding protein
MSIIHNLKYIHSAHYIKDLPEDDGFEIAFAGRSNAGKSSAINALANHNRLAYVSKQPGRTQLINFFQMNHVNNYKVVDLPGYGYAKVNIDMKKHWDEVLPYYLQNRKALIGLIIVMDIRHALTKLDEQMIDWFIPTNKPIHILLTKSDKLSRNQANKEIQEFQRRIEGCQFEAEITFQTFSSLKKSGLEDVEEIFNAWLSSGS